MTNDIIIYDIEATSDKPHDAIPRVMGFYSSKCGEYQWTTNIKEMVQILNSHRYIVGYNSDGYDNEVMKKYGFSTFGKISIDLMKIIHGSGFGNDLGRKGIMMVGKSRLADLVNSKTMKDTGIALNAPVLKGDIDYNIFKKTWSELTPQEEEDALTYLKNDVDITKHIYEFCEEHAKYFRDGTILLGGVEKPFMTPEWIEKKKYLTWSTASMVYHILCNLANLPAKFSDNTQTQSYEGGFVALPTQNYAEGNVYCLDFASLYPHIMIMCNLYGRVDGNGWSGGKLFTTNGVYNDKNLVSVSNILREIYLERAKRKKMGDKSEYTLKIIINTVYGLLGNPVFASVHDYISAEDCTSLGQQFIKYARKKYEENGYKLLYTDTDSVYLQDPYNDYERLMRVTKSIVDEIKSSVPFPQDTFDMDVDDIIKRIFFFEGVNGQYLKKNYMYVTEDDKLKIKGLQIIKSNATKLGRVIFDNHIRDKIVKTGEYRFKKSQISEWIRESVEKDKSLVSNAVRAREYASYKLDSQLQAQISKNWGEGTWNVVKLNRPHPKGVGTQSNYIKLEDFGGVSMWWVDLNSTWNELRHFIEPEKTLFSFI